MKEPTPRRALWLADAGAVVLLLAIALLLGLPRYRAGIDLADEGVLVHGAERVLSGELPNRDFVSLQPPLPYYSVALVFRLLGTSLAAERRFGLLLFVGIALGVYLLSRQVAGRCAALAASLPAPFLGMTIWVFAPYPTAQGLVLSLGAAWLAIEAARRGSSAWAAGAGAALALAILARHDQGFWLTLALAGYGGLLLWVRRGAPPERRPRRLLLAGAGSAAGMLVPLILAWWAAGALPGMYRDLVVFPLTRYAETSALPMPRWAAGMSTGETVLVGLFYVGPVISGAAVLWVLVRLIRGRLDEDGARAGFVALLALGFYHQVTTRSDVYHLVDTLPPLFVVGAFWLQTLATAVARRLEGRLTATGAGAAGAAAALVVGLAIWGGVIVTTRSVFLLPVLDDAVPLDLPRGGVRLPRSEAWVGPMARRLERHAPPDRPILVLPYRPMFYFLAGRRNPTSWNYLWPGDQTPDDLARMVAELRADPPAAVLLFDRPAMERHARPVLTYVDSAFRPAVGGPDSRLYLPARAPEP